MANYFVDSNGNVKKNKNKKKQPTYFVSLDGKVTKNKDYKYEDPIAPLKENEESSDEKWYQGWLKKGNGTFGQNLKATGVDVGEDLLIGGAGAGEKLLDTLMAIAPTVNAVNKVNSGKVLTNEDWEEHNKQRKESEEFIKKDLYDEEEVVKKNYTEKIEKKSGIDVESMSFFDKKADSLVQSAGQMGVTLTTSLANPLLGTAVLGGTAFGSEMENALNNGATYDEALISSTVSAGAEILTEKISGAIKLGGKTLDEIIPVDKLAQGISNKIVRNIINIGVDATGEGFEEIVSGYASAIGQKLTYMDEKEIKELFSSEDKLESFIGGAILGGVAGGVKTAVDTAKGKDSLTGMNEKEKAVFDKVYNDAVAEQETDGKKLSQKEKNKIYDETLKKLEKGYVDTDVIESALGGETYEEYKKLSKEAEEFNTLYTTESGKLSEQQKDRLAQLKEKNASKSYETAVGELKGRLTQEVKDDVKGNKLLEESYNEKARKSQKYEVDLSKYSEAQQTVIKKAVESGILNNTNRTHEFVEMVAKISADKGVSFDFINNAKLKESGFAIEGKTVNGYIKDGNIAVNIDSSKALNTVVGHEITHVLEGTELYTELQTMIKEYATSKGEYQTRYDTLAELYNDVDGAVIDNEVTADLVGEYLFTDADFINNLSTTKPNVFQKIYDEIKYLCKLATAGSKEAKEFEKLKRTFEKAYQESKANTTVNDVDFSLVGEENGIEVYETSEATKELSYKERQQKLLDTMKNEYAGRTAKFTKNGEVYYAFYSKDGLTKGVYGDKKSDKKGYKAKVNIGADGNYIELAENSLYKSTSEEQGKDNSFHRNAKEWDYYVKTIKSDGKYFDVLINVKNTGDKQFVYDITLKEAVSLPDTENVSYAGNFTASTDSIPQNQENTTDIKYSVSENVQKAKDYFGTTFKVSEAGYLTTDGRMLDFSGKKFGGSAGYRSMDHREITDAFDGDYGDGSYSGGMVQFMQEGNIRLIPESGGINLAVKPNKEQLSALDRYISSFRGEVTLDIDDANGNTVVSVEYPTRTYSKKIINDINEYFDNGVIPEQTSSLGQFRYSLSADSTGKTLTKEQQEYFKDSKAVNENGELVVVYHGTRKADFTVFNRNYNFFTDSEEMADSYAPTSEKFKGYVNIKKPFIVDAQGEKWSGIPVDAELKSLLETYGSSVFKEKGKWRTSTEDIVVAIEEAVDEGSLDYDGVIIKNVDDTGSYHKGKDNIIANDYIVFNSNQFKNVDNVNPTDNKDIRLSMGDRDATPTGNYNVYGKDIALEETVESDIAPKNSVEPTKTEQIISDNEEERDSEMMEAPLDEMQVLYSLEEEQNEKIAEVDNVVTEEDTVEASELPDLESFNAKLSNYVNALEGYKTARETIESSFDDIINKKMEEYDGLKRKDTNRATTLLMQIENLKLRKDNNITSLDNKISKVETTIEKLENGIPTRRQIYHRNLVDNIKNTFTNHGFDFDTVLDGAKDKGTFASVDNTPQRFIEKTLGYKEGQILNDLTVNKVAQNESKGIKWLNSFTDKKNGELAKISKEYGIKPRSKESASAQMYAEGFWVDDDGKFVRYGDEELAKDYPNEKVRENIKKLAKDERVRKIYDETLEMINESRKRNLYPEIPKRKNYFLHFREMDDTFSRLGIPFNPNDIRMKDLPTDINGMTADLQPGQPYFASAKQRIGYKTTYDLLGGVERYLNSAKNQIYHIDDIQTLRALRNYIAERFGQAKGLENLDTMDEAQALERIEQVYNSHLSTFAKFLNEEANVLAGKTTLVDRALEGTIGRRGIQFLNTVNRQVGSNMVGGNVSSALTNTVSMVQAVAKSNKFDSIKAFAQMTSNMFNSISGKSDGFVENNPMMIRRKGIEKMTRTPWESIVDKGYILAGAVDNISSEFIVRTKFNELTRKGMDEQKAHIEADKWASKILGDRSLGQQPLLYNSKMLGLVTKFQLEVRNQLDSQFYDTIQEANVSTEEIGNKLMKNTLKTAKIGSTFLQLSVLQHLFGQAFENMAGYNPTFDIIEVMSQMIGLDDDEDSEDTVLDNFEQGFLALLEDLPYTSTFTGGRIPIASALPIEQFITGKDDYGNEKSRWQTIKETAPYYLMPTGYGQYKKSKAGLKMFSEEHPISGSYTNSGNLRFPVEDTSLNRLQSGVFGQYASKNARDYFDDERTALKPKQIQEFKDLDIPIQEYWEIREGLSDMGSDAKLTEKGDYIANLDLPISKQNILINNIADREKKIDLSTYHLYSDFEEFDFATRYPEKYKVLQEQGISVKDYKQKYEETAFLYTDDFSWASDNMEKYTLSKAVTDDLIEYKKYTSELNDIKADKDKNGKTINGSAKKKKTEYINSLDLDYGQKIILYRSLYDSKEDKNKYDSKIVDYLYGRSDISYEDMEVILEELGIDW